MDTSTKDCKVESYKTYGCKIFGIILLVIAAILTLITLNGLGILGMFIAGLILCCHKHMGCTTSHCCCCCNKESTCTTTTDVNATNNPNLNL